MANKLTDIKRLPGIEGSWNGFCVHPDGSIALFYDYGKRTFVEISLTTGRKTLIQTKMTEDIESEPIIDLVAVVRSSELFIIALAYGEENEATKNRSATIVISFAYNSNTKTISSVDQHHIVFQAFPHFYKDEKGNLFLLSWDTLSIFSATQINVTDNGRFTTNDLISKTQQLEFTCMAAFIHSNTLYIVPEEDEEEDKVHLFKMPFGKEELVEVEVENDADVNATNCWSRPQIINDRVFFYNYNCPMQRGSFLSFDVKSLRWKRRLIDLQSHTTDEFWPCLANDRNGFLYLHGNCRLSSCREEVHLYIMKVI